MPNRPWLMTQTWHELLFLHWRMPPSDLRAQIPPQFELDVFEGQAWIGVVPFRMTNVSARGVPAVPGLSEFPELNVRTYVRMGDRPGVYFFSLDAGSALAVRAARLLLNLPYYAAAMKVQCQGEMIEYDAVREARDRLDEPGTPPAQFSATYRADGRRFSATPGSLDYFLTERYCLYNVDRRGRPYRLEIHHPPWPLQPAAVTIHRNSMAAAHRLQLGADAPLAHFAKRQDVVAWAPEKIE
jgi:uncharacterized protein YqjF (DUF2071 family)